MNGAVGFFGSVWVLLAGTTFILAVNGVGASLFYIFAAILIPVTGSLVGTAWGKSKEEEE